MLGPLTLRLIPQSGLYLINVTDTYARVNATAPLFQSFICIPRLPSPVRIRATIRSPVAHTRLKYALLRYRVVIGRAAAPRRF